MTPPAELIEKVVCLLDSPASSVVSLLNAATILSCQLQRGVDLPSALQQACGDTYAMCQRNAAKQKVPKTRT